MRPVSPDQWREAVDVAEFLCRVETAEFLLRFELGRLFGLVDDDFVVDMKACIEIIEDGRAWGIASDAKKVT